MSVRRSLIILSLLMFMIPGIVFWRYNRQLASQTNALDLSQLETYTVSRGEVEQIVSAIGTIEADQTVSLSFLTAGRVAELYIKPGDYMFAGEPLIRLDNDTQRIAYEQAQLAVDKAQLQLDEIIAPVSDTDLQLAQASVDSAWGSYLSASSTVTPDDIRAAELAYDQALNTYNDLKAARDQAPGGYGGPTYIVLDAQTGAASFNAEIARLRMESLKSGSQPASNATYARVILAQRQYDQVAAGPTQFQIDSIALGVRRAEAQLKRAETSYNRTTLVVPFDGLVSLVNVEVGTLVAPGLQIVEMTDLAPLRLTVQVDEIDIRFVQPGLPARVELDALPGVSIPAQIERIAFLGSNENGIVTYDVDFTLDTTDPRVRVGMTAEASIIVQQQTSVLTVPNIYIRLADDQAFINVLRDGKLTEIEVTLGLQGQDTSEVIAGLSEGDVIAIDPNGEGFSLFGN
ncbi:MAG: efflux RND transporter periplasmic adaptor subunit [Anaerolineae bacterium]|nr:efflux RND transporter periplasmic adaptor subunit [Anaerolineae bacterium]